MEAVVIVPAGDTQFAINLDRSSPIPLYHQLFEQIEEAVTRGDLKPGDTLEREDVLAERLQVARPTLRRALAELTEKGLITRSRRNGTTVTSIESRASMAPDASPTNDGGHAALAATRLLRFAVDHIDARIAAEMALTEENALVYREELHVCAGRRVSLRREWLPAQLVNPVMYDLATTSAWRILQQAGHDIVLEHRTYGRRRPDHGEMVHLGLSASTPIFVAKSVAFDQGGAAVHCAEVSSVDEDDLGLGLRAAC
jgi:GntR family transcriptional regulator